MSCVILGKINYYYYYYYWAAYDCVFLDVDYHVVKLHVYGRKISNMASYRLPTVLAEISCLVWKFLVINMGVNIRMY